MPLLKKFRETDKYARLSIIAIALAIAIRLALVFLYHSSGDGCWHLSIARFMAGNLKIPLLEPLGREVFWEPPFFHMIASAFYKVFSIFGSGAADFGMKLVSPLFGSLSLILTFIILDEFFGKKIAFYSIIFAAFLPINIFYSVISYTESVMAFFVLLCIYLIMKNRHILGSIAFGISLLSKYNAVFSLPLIIYLVHRGSKTRKEFLRKFFVFGAIAVLIFSPWVIRNYIALGNPLWPFFTSVFDGYESAETFKGSNISSLLNIGNLSTLYLGIFGVPEGSYQNIFFFRIPFIEMLFAAWLLATILFLTPILFYFKIKTASSKANMLILVWLVPHVLLVILYIINTSIAYSRLLVPVVPLFSALWGIGFSYTLNRLNKLKVMVFFILAVLITGFVAAEFVKTALASKAWNFYEEDFAWVKKSTNKDAVFAAGGQCLSYNLNRFTLNPTEENINNADYIWVNQNFRLDMRSILDESSLKSLQSKNYRIAYLNKGTGTVIYAAR
ncbi:glycosyltransferase family 39 protein [Candidatus Woesearchaeota archaeon]|nr:glycosyltransferase family 39 protein [Candidatus Woesearchaeota archaeon]